MKSILFIIPILFFIHASQSQVFKDIDKLAFSESKAFKNEGIFHQNETIPYGYQIIYHDVFFNINPEIRIISGSVKSIIQLDGTSTNHLRFDCANELIVDSIKREQTYLNYEHTDSNILLIDIGKDLTAGILDTFTIYYHGIPPVSGFGSFTQTYHNSIPNIWTLSEPFGAKDWWPCKQTLNDKIDSIDIYINIPIGNMAASNGILVGIDSTSTHKIFHWQHRYPIATYLVGISVTNYEEIQLFIPFRNDTLLYTNYVYPENYTNALQGAVKNIEVMQLYDSLFIPYPFMNEKYGQAQFGWGGGMEHQTMSFVGTFDFELLAHELAHQWFGDKITCGNWQDIWLNEGFATYLSGLCYEHLLDGYYWPLFKKNSIAKVCNETSGSVYIKDNEELSVSRIFNGRLSYSKGAMLLHMLRWKIGDNAFFTGIKNYLNNQIYAYNFSVSSNFIYEMEQASGVNLQEFFNDWLYGSGFPIYTISWQQQQDTRNIKLKITQTTSDKSVSFFEMPLAIKFFNQNSDSTLILEHTENNQFFEFNLPFIADSAQFDPEMWIVQKGSSIINITNELKKDELVIDFPNNMLDKNLELSISSNKDEHIELYLVNMMGQKIISENFNISFGKTNKNYSIDQLNKGYYILYIKAGKEEHSRKLFKL